MSLTKVSYSMINGATTNVLDYGAVGDGVTDDTAAIQAALNAGKIIFFPYGQYLITSQLIAPPEVSLTGPVQTPSNRGTIQGPVLVSSATLGSTPMLVIRAGSQVSNLAFRGVAKGTGVAIEARNVIDGTTGYVSTDVNITECGFTFFEYAVQHWNRGLKFERNDVQLCTYGVSLQWDEANFVDGDSRIDGLPQGFRAIKVNDNRFHLIEVCILNSATDREYLRGFQCNSNLVDAGDVLFNGGLYTGEFVGNVVDLSSTTTGVIRLLSDVQSVDITGNLFAGESDMPDTDNPAAYLIRAGGAVVNINIVGNTLRYAGTYNIYIQGRIYGGSISNNSFYNDDTKTSACIAFDSRVSDLVISGNSFQNTTTHGIVFSDILERSSITANTFYNIGTDAVSTDACVKTQSTFTDVTITANSFFPVTALFGVRGITTEAWTRVIVDNNVCDTTKTLAAQYQETGTNYIQGEVVASPTQLTADVNNYAPSNASTWRLSSNASRSITGLESSYIMVGRILTIINVGSNDIVLKNLSGSSSASNQIITGTGADITLTANKSSQLIYDFTSLKWRVI